MSQTRGFDPARLVLSLPPCPKCGAAMWLARIEAVDSNQDKRTFDRRYAEEAQLQADKAISAKDKESWLKIARSWLEMLPKRTPTAEDQFNDKVRDLGTGQEESGSMN